MHLAGIQQPQFWPLSTSQGSGALSVWSSVGCGKWKPSEHGHHLTEKQGSCRRRGISWRPRPDPIPTDHLGWSVLTLREPWDIALLFAAASLEAGLLPFSKPIIASVIPSHYHHRAYQNADSRAPLECSLRTCILFYAQGFMGRAESFHRALRALTHTIHDSFTPITISMAGEFFPQKLPSL